MQFLRAIGRTALLAAATAMASLALAQAWPASAQDVSKDKKLPEWDDYFDAFRAVGDNVIGEIYKPDDPANRQDAWYLLFGELARGYLAHAYVDPDYPEFVPLYNNGINIAAPNPDYIYYGTSLDGDGVYRLRGFRGTNRFTYIQFVSSRMADGGPLAKQLNGFSLDDVPLGPDGAFDIILSNDRPQGYTGSWIRLDPATRGAFMRIAGYDWVHERDSVVGIDRLDKPARRPRVTAEETAAKLAALPPFIKGDSVRWWRHMADLQKRDMWNRLGVEPWGSFAGQVYLEGLYKLADDEGLLIETEIPKTCRYWGFLVGDMQFRTIDWANHQSSLNGFQAKPDSDGKFRAVISNTDPGVPNWLDTGGYREGVIQGRWNKCDTEPTPTVKLVKLADLRRQIPADTPVVTPAQRDAQLRERRLGAQLRRKW